MNNNMGLNNAYSGNPMMLSNNHEVNNLRKNSDEV